MMGKIEGASNVKLETLNSDVQKLAFSIGEGNYSIILVHNNEKYHGSFFTESDKTKKLGLNINYQFENLTIGELSIYIKEKIYGKKRK